MKIDICPRNVALKSNWYTYVIKIMPVKEMKQTAYNVKDEKDHLFKVCSKYLE
jgi:hypothetical protein